jgi:hypothetical protein
MHSGKPELGVEVIVCKPALSIGIGRDRL